MDAYSYEASWILPAPVAEVWPLIADNQQQVRWWQALEKAEVLHGGNRMGLGRKTRLRWKTPLAYSMEFELTVNQVVPGKRINYLASGELEGQVVWHFSPTGPAETKISCQVNIFVTSKWVVVLSTLFKPLFTWNMLQGFKHIKQNLAQAVSQQPAASTVHNTIQRQNTALTPNSTLPLKPL